MGVLLLGVNTLYRLFCFFKLFLMAGKGLIAMPSLTNHVHMWENADFKVKLYSFHFGILFVTRHATSESVAVNTIKSMSVIIHICTMKQGRTMPCAYTCAIFLPLLLPFFDHFSYIQTFLHAVFSGLFAWQLHTCSLGLWCNCSCGG